MVLVGMLLGSLKTIYPRQKRFETNCSYAIYRDITIEVPQGSYLGSLLFNVSIDDVFLLVQNSSVCNYADDTTIYVCNSDLDTILNGLETDISILDVRELCRSPISDSNSCVEFKPKKDNSCYIDPS